MPDPTAILDPMALLEQIDNKVSALVTDAIQRNREPGPYQELAAAVAKLQADNENIQKLVTLIAGLTSHHQAPEITVSHDQLADGTWRYKTSVTLKPESSEAMVNTLGWVDEIARQEAQRREAVDSASGRTFSKPRAPRLPGVPE